MVWKVRYAKPFLAAEDVLSIIVMLRFVLVELEFL